MKIVQRAAVIVFLIALCASPALAQHRLRPTAYNVLYGTEDEGSRRLDVYLPEAGEAPYPVVLMFHGYGANKGAMPEFGLPEIAARAGAATVAVSYATDEPLNAYKDAYCALAWVQAHGAEHGLDPSRIVTLGHSYGGLPATMLAVQEDPSIFSLDCPHPAPDPEAVLGVISLSGVLLGSGAALEAFTTDAPVWQVEGAAELVRNTPPEDWLALDLQPDLRSFLGMWPMAWIDESEPPHLLIHGAADTTIPFENSYAYAEVLSRNRTNVTVVVDRLSGHAPPPFVYDRETVTFLERVLGT